jgi:CheY-like chemotaxis protein
MTDHKRTAVLVIEADPLHRRSLVGLLESEGYLAFSSSTIPKAMEYLNDNDPPRVILMGTSDPSLNPGDLFSLIRTNPLLAWIPVLLMADFTGDSLRLIGDAYRPYAVLHRPVHPEALLEVIRLAVILRPAPK